ncbi:MAG: hypothetical protein LBH00_08475 [Planctomycetaceae bacterium]|jgi:RNA polymerase sigma factor (sigma-70 family)|nr:hypothetical protein [Planctomycetaceae bacterium]
MNPCEKQLLTILNGIKEGQSESFTLFFEKYFGKLSAAARNRLSPHYRIARDEEDFAVSALNSFYQGIAGEHYHSISSENELWKVLLTIVSRKIFKHIRSEQTQKRGGGTTIGESAFTGSGESEGSGLADLPDTSEITPLMEAEFADTSEELFQALDDEPMRSVARFLLEGYTLDEIAEQLGCVKRTVERKLKRIREIWKTITDQWKTV